MGAAQVPKRLRYFMQRDGPVLNMVLRIFSTVIFHAASAIDETAVAQVQADLRRRILRAFVGRGLLQSEPGLIGMLTDVTSVTNAAPRQMSSPSHRWS